IIEENAEYKVRIEELEKNSADISAENAELKAELAKLRHDFDSSNLTRLQQLQHITNAQNSCSGEEKISEVTAVPQPDAEPERHFASNDIPDSKMPQEIKCPTSDPVIHDQKRVTGGSKSHKKKGMDELKHELFTPSESDSLSSINHNNVTEVSEMAHLEKVTYSIDEASQHLAQLCDKVIDAEDRANRANQEEILCWCLYWKDFRDQLDEIIRSNGGKFGKKKARGMLYDTITEQLSILCKKRSQELGLKLRNLPHMTEISKTAHPEKNLTKNTPPKTK
ncbi:16960_t:CDS:2, partial [Dentiscutata erythropus]